MKYILIYLLNLVDYATTVYWTSLHGIQTETNPLMRMALENPWVFAVIKLVLFPLLLLYMWKKKHDDTAWMARDVYRRCSYEYPHNLVRVLKFLIGGAL